MESKSVEQRHANADDIKAAEVDWRAHCMKMVDAIENGTLGQVDDAVRAAKAAKGDYVDWRGMCEEFCDELAGLYEMGRDNIDKITEDNLCSLIERAKASLEATK